LIGNARIRRLTPVECERLQGFPDGWTARGLDASGKEVTVSDTQRYKMLGNAVTVNVIEFLGKRVLEKVN
jgi:DNA (cytosine-5)-methyltransferase 1